MAQSLNSYKTLSLANVHYKYACVCLFLLSKSRSGSLWDSSILCIVDDFLVFGSKSQGSLSQEIAWDMAWSYRFDWRFGNVNQF